MDGDLFIYFEQCLRVQYRSRPSHHGEKPLITVGLLRTCKQIHSEATPILYGSNTLGASRLHTVKFLQSIGSSIRHIRSFFLPHYGSQFGDVCKELKKAPLIVNLSLTRLMLEEGIERLSQTLAPLMKSLNEAWNQNPDKKKKDVIEILHVDPGLLGSERAEREHTIAVAKKCEEEVKHALREKLGLAANSNMESKKEEIEGSKNVNI